jgi:hypothetical protein
LKKKNKITTNKTRKILKLIQKNKTYLKIKTKKIKLNNLIQKNNLANIFRILVYVNLQVNHVNSLMINNDKNRLTYIDSFK